MGNIAGFGANHHLRQTLAFLNMPTLGQPEAYIASAQNAVDDKGEIVEQGPAEAFFAAPQHDRTKAFLQNML